MATKNQISCGNNLKTVKQRTFNLLCSPCFELTANLFTKHKSTPNTGAVRSRSHTAQVGGINVLFALAPAIFTKLQKMVAARLKLGHAMPSAA